jgi:uncharacterized protein involved in exopolysaccharide biosynthesis
MSLSKKMEQQMYSLDTHESVKYLVSSGLKEEQAEKIVKLVHQSRNYDLANLVTKDQLESTKNELKADIAEVRTEIAEVKSELKTEIAEIRTEISNIKFDILKWIMPIMISNTMAIIGLVVAIFLKK